ncbi:unnamed protein product [Peronospora belbahrii]|uniref:Transcription elongation factor Eaf N-terminal domain-containing protein n=1 Tax=Peronospora belbahrii TaxID=622444 RepID=A0AAU9KTM0_9STRA|nr:unnamed protein product [Peronospora belbahrii]CAH0518463.1 unnamed protein product [Peronospora belbahrii]
MNNTTLTPLDDHEYPVVLGKSLTETDDEVQEDQQPIDNVFVSFGYEFQPASVDKSTPGLVSVDSSNGVNVLMSSSTGAAGGVNFKGKLVEHKETDCLLLFDGTGFRLERCPFSCMQLRHVRAPTPRRRVKLESKEEKTDSVADATLVSKKASTPTTRMTGEARKRLVSTSKRIGSKRVAEKSNAAETTKKRQRGRPKGSTKAATKA